MKPTLLAALLLAPVAAHCGGRSEVDTESSAPIVEAIRWDAWYGDGSAAKAGLNYWAFLDNGDESSEMHIALNRYRAATGAPTDAPPPPNPAIDAGENGLRVESGSNWNG